MAYPGRFSGTTSAWGGSLASLTIAELLTEHPSDGFQLHPRAGSLPDGSARMARSQSAAAAKARGKRTRRRELPVGASQALAQEAPRRRMGRPYLAQTVRRPRRDLRRAGHLPAGTRTSQPPNGMQRARRDHDRPRADAVGHRGTEAALPEEDSERRGNLVGGHVGAGRRLGSRRDADPRRARWRQLHRQRPEG